MWQLPFPLFLLLLAPVAGRGAEVSAAENLAWMGLPLRGGGEEQPTATDKAGPDGLYYPDWSRAGNPDAHRPEAHRVFSLAAFGGHPNDGNDDANALQRAVDAAAEAGGGVVALDGGQYFLDAPVFVRGDGVALRGAGRDRTRLVFRYAGPEAGLAFVFPAPESTVGPGTWIEVHARPAELEKLELWADGKLVHRRRPVDPAAWNQTFALRLPGKRILAHSPPGPVSLLAQAHYRDGRVLEARRKVRLDGMERSPPRMPQVVGIGAITFLGARPHGERLRLAAEGARGDRRLTLERADHGLGAGAKIVLVAPNTERWFREIRNKGPINPDYRRYQFLVERVEGRHLYLDQPLRQPYPTADGAYVQRLDPIENASIASLELEMRSPLPGMNGIMFLNAWACRATDLRVLNAPRHQLLFSAAKWCRVEDSVFRDRRSKGGGTDYVGFQDAYDCLMQGVVAWDMRHAPVVQWSAAGNVIRQSSFFGSDGQWHAGWTNENLFEDCLIVSRPETGSYGFGLWASPPEDPGHGANGHRNVVYRCRISSPKAGVWLGGMNERWLFLYNHFAVETGPGFVLAGPARGHLVRGNTFVLEDPGGAAIRLEAKEIEALEFSENRFFMPGGTPIFSAEGKAPRNLDNTIHPHAADEAAAMPEPPVPSLYLWQRRSATVPGESP